MSFLLDSHALVAWIRNERFDRGARRRVGRAGAAVSAVSVWELGMKQATGKLRMPVTVVEAIVMHEFDRLDITYAHAERTRALPLHHRDPFDRMLIAQAQVEGLTIVTRDAAFDAYDVDVLRC
jgi:PIN domain nuclease of toxin-antitoxin system